MATGTSSRSSELTPRQNEVLQVIREHIEKTGAPPTRAEIAKTLGFRSVNAAEDHLKALARKGAITLSPGTSRGIQLANQHGLGLPIIGDLQPQTSLLSQQNIHSRLRIDQNLFDSPPDFLFKVTEMSLSDAGIRSGDLLAVKQSDQASDGQIVLARFQNQLIARRYKFIDNQARLIAENPEFYPQSIAQFESPFQIEGIGVGIIRTKGF